MWLQMKPSLGVCTSSPGSSELAWWMRCIATQEIAPPSLASMPATVPRYSSGFHSVKPRCVRRRW